jgi:nucleoid-associated protein YgaU
MGTTIPIDEVILLPEQGEQTRPEPVETRIVDNSGNNLFRQINAQDPLGDAEARERLRQLAEAERQNLGQRPQETARQVPPVEPQTAARSYVVEKGDNLGAISMKVYGTSRHWKRIQEANRISDPTALQVGQTLSIPAIDGAVAVPPRETPVRELSDGRRSYTVRKGDSFYIIAQRELGDAMRWREIQELNRIDPYDLMVGQEIILPAGRRALVETPRGDEVQAPPGARLHVVARGEVLGAISQQYYGTARRWREIAQANGISDPESLRAGQRLIIPRLADRPFGNTAETAAPRTVSPVPVGSQRYAIRSGDTLADLAQRFYGDENQYRRIIEANPGLNPRRLLVGQELVIPGASQAPRDPRAPRGGTTVTPPSGGEEATRLRDLLRQTEGG